MIEIIQRPRVASALSCFTVGIVENETMTNVNQVVDEAYQLWLYHAPYLYDFCTTHVLEFPSHTVAWMSDSRRAIPLRDYAVAQIATGTVSQGVNYVTINHCFVHTPLDEEEIYSEEEIAAFRGYQGQFGDVSALMQRHCRFVHDGPVSLIVPLPQRPQILAVRGRNQFISVTDIGRRRAEPEDDTPKPDMRLKGHKREGYGMDWNPIEEGTLATASADTSICIYKLEADLGLCGTRPTVDLSPAATLSGHSDVVDGVSWHPHHSTVLASCSFDKQLRIWDLRAGSGARQSETVHRDAVHSVQFHPTADFVLATGSADNAVRVWDMRNFSAPAAEFVGHTDAIHGVKWAPFSDSVLMSYGADRTVICWDIGKIGQHVDGDDDHAPPELVFKHTGHTAHVREASWAPFAEDEWTVASVDDNNMLMLWSPHDDIYNDEMDLDNYNTEVV
jgi:histone-binding protein RBBP4